MNRAEEDYIKSIYELTFEKKVLMIKTNELSERFGFSDQSVNEMIKKLEQKNLVSFMPYKGISLTAKGKKVAIRMVRSHRIWEVFLTEKLGFSWDSVHEDAEMLEHATSDLVLEKLYHFLGEPKYCQHGNPIPNFKDQMEPVATLMLYDGIIGEHFEVRRVLDHKQLLTYLDNLTIKLFDHLEIIEKDDFNQMMSVKKDDNLIQISLKTAKMIFGVKI
jgi:DtxR family transcriptional regulator, Mn-dependent transcriptional regulator